MASRALVLPAELCAAGLEAGVAGGVFGPALSLQVVLKRADNLVGQVCGAGVVAEQTPVAESALKRLECLELVGVDVAWEVFLGEVDVHWLTGVGGLADLLSGSRDVDAGRGTQAAVEECDDPRHSG